MQALSALVSPTCQKAFLELSFPIDCVKSTVLNGLNLGVLLGALAIKLPQILKIVEARSVAGISESSLVLELISATCACLYALLMGHPFASWGEMFFISVQCLMLNALYWRYARGVSVARRMGGLMVGIAIVLGVVRRGVPSAYLPILATLPITLNLMARVPQIMLNYNNRATGQLAVVTFALAFLGNMARVLTTVSQLNDPVTLASHATAAALNGTILVQILYYGKGKKVIARDIKKKKTK